MASGAGLAHTYVMTVWSMLEECAGQLDEPFRRNEMIGWFRRHHPDVNEATLGAHIQAATENAANRARNNPLGARPALLRRIDHGMYVRARLPGEPAVDLAGQVDVPEPPGMDSVAADVILVGCVRTKRAGPCAAAELFTSPLFEGRHQYATASGLRWYILSAKFGLLAPGDVIGPYDVYLADQSAGYRRAWGEFVTAALEQRESDLRGRTIEIHAGAAYVDPLRAPMAARGATLAVPLAHLRQGEQLGWYKKHPIGSFSSTARPSPPGPMPGTGAGNLVRTLSDPSQALSPHELLGHGSRGLLAAGMYSWWADEPGAADLSRGLGQPVAPHTQARSAADGGDPADQQRQNRKRVRPPGSVVKVTIAERGSMRYTFHGGGPCDGALNGAVMPSPLSSGSAGQPWSAHAFAARASAPGSVTRAASPSTTTSASRTDTAIEHRGSRATLRPFRVLAPVWNQNVPASHRAPTAVTCGLPSWLMVDSQVVREFTASGAGADPASSFLATAAQSTGGSPSA